MSIYLAEFLGTAILIFLGDGAVANMVLNKSKANGGGWISITTGWALAVAIPVFIFGSISGAHFNPALTLGFAVIGKFAWAKVPGYILAQVLGGIFGGSLVYLFFQKHFDATEDADAKRDVFCTSPAIKGNLNNFLCEFMATFIFIFALLGVGNTKMVNGFAPLIVGGIILSMGLSLGGTTGYAINPARDLGPRIAHYLMPIKNKEGSNWWYAWIPVLGPICGGIAAALFFKAIF
ncbi:MIP/aquaporin family protein [Clostridium sp.]|jgi:glycerol uptake facilitator protein|uniref:MIP/aquaporin family protein n=1 Tax=Clostridium sp. TaxID=1506 RepID=UPI003EE95888